MRLVGGLLPALLALCAALRGARAARAPAPSPGLAPSVRRYELVIGVGQAAPDCFLKQVLTVNGQSPGPTLEVAEGQVLEVYVENRVPAAWPAVLGGLSLHWHGLGMQGAPFYDGVPYVHQCPIRAGGNFTYRFQVLEPAGTYWWHAHSGAERVDGLQGPLIIRPAEPTPPAVPYDEERVLTFTDVYHATSGALSFPLNRPFDPAKMSPEAGGWEWVDIPQGITLNGRGLYPDCALQPVGNTANVSCRPTLQWIPPGRSAQLPFNSPTAPACARENVTVAEGKAYLLRMLNMASLSYLTVCFEGHSLTLVAADGRPLQPLEKPCVDINAGQRIDAVLKADKPPGNYWITAQMQYRAGGISGYSVLRYEGANATLPASPAPQPLSLPAWTDAEHAQLRSPALNGSAAGGRGGSRPQGAGIPPANRTVVLNNTQPLLATGQLRWALNNVATYETPQCTPALLELIRDHAYLQQQSACARPTLGAFVNETFAEAGNATQVSVFLEEEAQGKPAPTPGQLFTRVALGEVIDIVVQNLAANANGGDYRNSSAGRNRTAQEQHPFHLHGYHFWVLGRGDGVWDPVRSPATYNTLDPPLRDTHTVSKGQWTAIRFAADNPGLWALHCHLDWHDFMGQRAYFLVGEANLTAPAALASFPACPATCNYNFAPWRPAYVKQLYGDSGFSY